MVQMVHTCARTVGFMGQSILDVFEFTRFLREIVVLTTENGLKWNPVTGTGGDAVFYHAVGNVSWIDGGYGET